MPMIAERRLARPDGEQLGDLILDMLAGAGPGAWVSVFIDGNGDTVVRLWAPPPPPP
jgi:hypothetical protein